MNCNFSYIFYFLNFDFVFVNVFLVLEGIHQTKPVRLLFVEVFISR